MLPAANRMRRAADFTSTVRRGARVSRGCVVACATLVPAPDPGAAPDAGPGSAPQVGLIVSKRVGGSVVRHRVSRRLRAAAATVISTLPPGSMIVLRALPGAGTDDRLVEDTVRAIEAAVGRASEFVR